MAGDKEDHEFMNLHLFKEEYIAKLKALGIESNEDLADALADVGRTDEIHEHLKGVGPMTIQHWREDLGVGESDVEQPEKEPAVEKVRTVKAKEPVASEDDTSEDKEDVEVSDGEDADVEIEEEEEDEDVEVEEEEEEGYRVKLKPTLSKEILDALKKRKLVASRRPTFLRQEYHKRQKLQRTGWRRPRGMHSKMRRNYSYRTNVVSIGYGSPKQARYLHPSGFQEVVVHNVKDLEGIDPKVQAARVAHTVGMRKRTQIEDKADELSIRILNRSG
ncbi:MAG: 50S ribosomal protein L32e [Candidatus Thermoplasmatota archaeon]|nr:50S ribosomal protein L32e [Candidatus Thermoplasmatota archaeon]